MGNVDRHARRILAGVRRGSKDEAIFPGYTSFEGAARPRWWNDSLAEAPWGRVLGVHENEAGSLDGAIVITELGLAVLAENAEATWLPYSSIDGWERLSKDPVSRTLTVRSKSGQNVELRFYPGGAFAFVQFLISAIGETERG